MLGVLRTTFSWPSAAAQELLDQLAKRARREYVSPVAFATLHTGLGEADAALDALVARMRR